MAIILIASEIRIKLELVSLSLCLWVHRALGTSVYTALHTCNI